MPAAGVDALAARLGLVDVPTDLLAAAMVHRSWCAEHAGYQSNERLEFLGDAVLGLAVTDRIYRDHPGLDEGVLTDLRKSAVNSVALAEVAGRVGLGSHLVLGKGEELSGGRHKPSILADAVEAVIGATYLHAGFEAACALVDRLLGPALELGADGHVDHKSRLQELVARRFASAPRYDVVASGPDHARSFDVTVTVDGTAHGRGTGRSKKQAEQAAAREAVTALSGPAAQTPPAPQLPAQPQPGAQDPTDPPGGPDHG